MANETLASFKFAYDLLTPDAYLTARLARRVYDTRPPQIDPDDLDLREPAYPLILIHAQHAQDLRKGGARRTFSLIDLVVKAVAQEQGAASLGGINSRIDALMNNPGTVDVTLTFPNLPDERYTILGGYRLGGLDYAAWDYGVRYDYLGGLYRVHVQRRTLP